MVAGNSAEAEKALQDELDKPERETGEIILVGAGPGDAGLLTLRGLQAIQQADVVFHDHLVTQPVLELVRRDAELICVGKRAGEHSVPQHETNQLLVEAAKAGKTVVRLKGGDPFIFTRRRRAAGCRRGGDPVPWCRASPQPPGRRPTPVFR